MPYVMKKELKNQGIVITFSGIVKKGEVQALDDKLSSDKQLSKLRYQIWDFSKIKDIKVSFDELRNCAILDAVGARKNPHKKIAIIVRKQSASGLDSMFHAYEKAWGGYESATFTDIEAAKKWALSD
jgi:hypothetical protein